MAEGKSSKELAQRIDPAYHGRRHPLRRVRLLLSAGLSGAAALWVALSFALPAEGIYARGGVAAAHAPLEQQCDRCHVERFAPVRDASCVACHGAGAHVPLDETPADPACASCHAEHAGRARLVAVADGHCNACHDRHRFVTTMEEHVQFGLEPREQHLRFSHKGHLSERLLGGPLACVDCHRPQPEGRDFAPVRFEEHCARCHRERLHPDAGDEVPHGLQPDRLRDWALAILVKRALAEGQPPAGARPSSVPGRAPGAPPEWTAAVRAQADAALDALLTAGRGCLLCHEGDRKAIVSPEIPSNWLPKARFDHKTHRVERCETCHAAHRNGDAAHLDVPGVETCRSCHAPGRASPSCVTCHPYHPADPSAWR
jgi:hypothetical protein